MSNADRIEELRNKYEENPRRYFAPLANEYRKAGDLAQAIAICREHLPKQPGHMSGFIVFGQTLFEANNLDEARSVFEQALALDPENLIALKHLGDIARTKGETSVARRWYERVLDADPRNDDIALQLASLSVPTPAAAIPVVPESVVRAAAPPLEDAIGVFATFDPSSLLDLSEVKPHNENVERWEPQASASPRPIHHEPIDLDFPDSPEPVENEVAAEEFEEGLMAPQWPDTSELVARLVTPLRSATPISSEITPDAVEAFGREAHESAESVRVEFVQDDNFVEAFLPSQEITTHAESLDFADEENTDDNEITAEYPVVRAEALNEVFAQQSAAAAEEEEEEEEEEAEITVQSFDAAEETEPQAVEENFASESDIPEVATVVAQETVVVEPFELPVEFAGDATASFEIEEFAEATAIEEFVQPVAIEEFAEPVAIEEFVQPVAIEEFAQPLAEESYAEISSELQTERLANDAMHESDELFANDPNIVVEQAAVAEHVAPFVASVQSEQAAPAFVTETMAELLVSQGFVGRAIEIYEELVHRNPEQPVLSARLEELRVHEATIIAAAQSIRTPRYSTPIRSTPVYVTPQLTPHSVTPHSFTPHSVTPQYSSPQHTTQYTPQFSTPLSTTPLSTTPISTPVTPSYAFATAGAAHEQVQLARTARDRFAELARRRVPRRTPTHATAVADDPSDGLSSLFGTAQPTSPDELAARALADAFGPVQDSGESLFDFSSVPTPTTPLRALTPRSNTPLHVPAMASIEHRPAQSQNADYSFDRFFPDPAVAERPAQATTMASNSDSESSPPANEDLAQFSAWLKGLNNA
ncbi:MAG: tetratricopeptide repeat protein [Gemmatimonadaceae bacterium]